VIQAAGGYGIYNLQASPTSGIARSFSNAQSAIFNRNSSPEISSCVFSNNGATCVYNQQFVTGHFQLRFSSANQT